MNQNILIIVYAVLMVVLALLNFIPQLKDKTALLRTQTGFLFVSSFMLLVLFLWLKSFIIDDDYTYVILIAILYSIWYYVVKLLANKISVMDYGSDNIL